MKETVSPQAGMHSIHADQVSLRKATLVVEYGQDFLSGTALLKNLSRVIKPETLELTLVHAEFDWLNEQSNLTEDFNQAGLTISERETVLRNANEKVRQELAAAGFTIVSETDCGLQDKSQKSLISMLEETEQDLLIIASAPLRNERAKASHFAFNLASHAPVSVLMYRNPIPAPPHPPKVIFGVDGSEASMNVARKLGQILDTREIRLELVTAQSPIYQENAVLAPFVNQTVLDEALEMNANIVFEMVTDILETQNIPVSERRKLIGSPATELGNLAELEHPDLIVLGSHNRTGVLAWLMGSVSSQLLHWDSHNLLVVR